MALPYIIKPTARNQSEKSTKTVKGKNNRGVSVDVREHIVMPHELTAEVLKFVNER